MKVTNGNRTLQKKERGKAEKGTYPAGDSEAEKDACLSLVLPDFRRGYVDHF